MMNSSKPATPTTAASPARRVASRVDLTYPDGSAEIVLDTPDNNTDAALGLGYRLKKVFSREDHQESSDGTREEKRPLSPPRRLASRVTMMVGGVPEVVLDEDALSSSGGAGDDNVASSLKRAPSHHNASAQENGTHRMIEDDINEDKCDHEDEDESPLYSDQTAVGRPKKMSRLRSAFLPLRGTSSLARESKTVENIEHNNSSDDFGPQKYDKGGRASNDDNDDETIAESVDTAANIDTVPTKPQRKLWRLILIGVTFIAFCGGLGYGISYTMNKFLFPSSAEVSNTEAEKYIIDHGDTATEKTELHTTTPASDVAAFYNEDRTFPTIQPLTITTSTTNPTSLSFYVMADAPYSDFEREEIMPQQIANLNSKSDDGAAFLVHLGDLQKASVDQCQEYAYQNASDILKNSTLPVFVLPGDNDINDCGSLEHGEAMWREFFYKLDELWDYEFQLSRWGALDESFAFLHNGILFFGLNIIGGYPASFDEWHTRHMLHRKKVKALMTAHKDDFSVAVLFGHASPGEYHSDFFEGEHGLAQFVKDMGKPFLHLHGDDHKWYELEGAFDVENYMMICLDSGKRGPPIRVEIDVSKANPIKIDRMEDWREVECCSDGWPRVESTMKDKVRDGYDNSEEEDQGEGGDDTVW